MCVLTVRVFDMSRETETTLASNRKRRGVVRASITRIDTRVGELEEKGEALTSGDARIAQQLLQRLSSLDSDFKSYHFSIIDVIGEDSLEAEQRILDGHDDKLANLSARLQELVASSTVASRRVDGPDSSRLVIKKLAHVDKAVKTIVSDVESAASSPDVDSCLLHQYEEQLSALKNELSRVSDEVLSYEGDDEAGLSEHLSKLNKAIFDVSLRLKRLRKGEISTSATSSEGDGMKLPKLEVPTFDGSITNWRSFWEQFSISVDSRSKLSDAEKLTYLRVALRDGSAKNLIEGLSGSGSLYKEAIDCLRKRFDRPRLLHQAHVRVIVEAPSLKDGSGKELRRLHDTVTQHLRALNAMGCEPSGPFVTSMLELKLDTNTMFEWQKHSQESTSVPHYTALLDFINLRAQASESTAPEFGKKHQSGGVLLRKAHPPRSVTSLTASADDSCLVCKAGKHPLYACQRFKSFPHDKMISTLKTNGLCINCLKPGHYVKRCTSSQRCRRCQKPHHTLLHVEVQPETREPPPTPPTSAPPSAPSPSPPNLTNLPSHVAQGNSKTRQPLLMTCRILVSSPDGFTTQARAMLDSASSSSFVSERLAQHLRLPRSGRLVQITGIGGVSHNSVNQSVSHFRISPVWRGDGGSMEVEAIVLPKVTLNVPVHPVSYDSEWHHLSGIQLADPDFGTPGRVDVLLGVDVFTSVLLHGRRHGPSGSPVALETLFGWVLAGGMKPDQSPTQVTASHASVLTGDDLLRKFWETEELDAGNPTPTIEEKSVTDHFKATHHRDDAGRFIVALPMRSRAKPLGESRSLAVRRFLSLEKSMRAKQQFEDFATVMDEYFHMGHAEPVPDSDLDKPCDRVFYLPMHAVRKDSSSTTKLRAVFDASAKSASGVSLNDQLLVGPTVHSSLVDVLLRFRLNRIALTADVSRMYRAVLLPKEQRDLHMFVWRSQPDQVLKDYRMTRVTFGVAASSFAANMAVRQNAIEHAEEFPLAASAVFESFYVDDGLVGADSVEGAVNLQRQLQELFSRGGFLLRKWKSSNPAVLQNLDSSLLDPEAAQAIHDPDNFSKTLGLEWSARLDSFRLTVAEMPRYAVHTKRALVSDVARTFDALGWFAPSVIVVKMLLQRLWEAGVGWDDPVPQDIRDCWEKWRLELPVLSSKLIPRCYFPNDAHLVSLQLHGFSDASELAYSAVVYARMVDSSQRIHVSLVMAKTKVAPLKRLTIPRLELSGANLLANLLHHIKVTLHVPSDSIYAWTDSMIVLCWLTGSPRRFKPFVGSRVSNIMEVIPPDRWSHVECREPCGLCVARPVSCRATTTRIVVEWSSLASSHGN